MMTTTRKESSKLARDRRKIRKGQTVTVTIREPGGRSEAVTKVGKVEYINHRNRYYALRVQGNYIDPMSGRRGSYLECYKY